MFQIGEIEPEDETELMPPIHHPASQDRTSEEEDELARLIQQSDCPSSPGSMNLMDSFSLLDLSDDSNDELGVTPIPGSELSSFALWDCSTLENSSNTQPIPASFGFEKFQPPELLCRHPPPAIGRDDDIVKLKEILDDQLIKMGYKDENYQGKSDRILVGADHKIASNLIKLISRDAKYSIFIPEFPLLHMRKSKITTLFSAYKSAGLLQLLQYMRDDDRDEWSKLASAEHIDAATRNVKRLAVSIHLALLLQFMTSLSVTARENMLNDLATLPPVQMSSKWDRAFQDFIISTADCNATFALHIDMMRHCDEIAGLDLAERLGGPQGYKLLLAIAKESLPFSFLNGASSYGPFCTHLLHHHYSAGVFHTNMKECLFSTPIGNTAVNFSCDSKREIDHQDVMKGFRSGSTTSSVVSRMSLIDPLNEIHKKLTNNKDGEQHVEFDNLGWEINQVDSNHILRTADLILRRGGLSTCSEWTPYNVYMPVKVALPCSILDIHSFKAGEYLIEKFACKQQLFGRVNSDIPALNEVHCAKPLWDKLHHSKGVTIRRSGVTLKKPEKSQREMTEEGRKKSVARELKHIQCFSSTMNTCQSLVKPDCTKPVINKAMGITKALDQLLDSKDPMLLVRGTRLLPDAMKDTVKVAAIEFAGVKFKTKATSGSHYIEHIQANVITPVLLQFKKRLTRIIICEEKYAFTPDDFKAHTRKERQHSGSTISHLKQQSEIISETTFNQSSVKSHPEAKKLISTFLSANIHTFSIKHDFLLDVDSQLHITGCKCASSIPPDACKCNPSATPLRCSFNKDDGLESVRKLHEVTQRKGEAEMAIMDWVIEAKNELKPGDSVASIITSGDIDSVVIHLFCLTLKWPRDSKGCYINNVFIILQKPGNTMDVHNITAILEHLQHKYDDQYIGVKVAALLCMGGNDFIPKFHGISHSKVLLVGLRDQFRNSLINVDNGKAELDSQIYLTFVKHLFCPKRLDPETASFEQVRKATIKPVQQNSNLVSAFGFVHTRNPQLWLPPAGVLSRLALLVQLQLDYLCTAGDHAAEAPIFIGTCLQKNDDGDMEYDFGPESHISNLDELPTELFASATVTLRKSMKRGKNTTPQKGRRQKRPMTSTPQKQRTSKSK